MPWPPHCVASAPSTWTTYRPSTWAPPAWPPVCKPARPPAARGLSRDAELLHDTLLGTACLHIVHFFTQRSAFVARTLVQQSRSLDSLIGVIDAFLAASVPAGRRRRVRAHLSRLPRPQARPADHLRHRSRPLPGPVAAGRGVPEPGGHGRRPGHL
ncbi:NACHT N-terminal Helical domain 1-containing protein [Streptomyces sp. NPDC054765]